MKKQSLNGFFNKKIDESLSNINTCLICEVLEVDMNALKANVLPLTPGATPILDVPIAYQQTGNFLIQVPYKKGDKVLVVCSKTDIDSILFSGGEVSSRSFSENDALIVGGINLFTTPLENENPEDLVIGTKDFKTKMVISENGDISVKSTNFTVEANNITLTGSSITANGEDLTVDLV